MFIFIYRRMTIIFEAKTTQTPAVKTLIDCLNSLLTDVNINISPYYINDELESDDSDYDSESEKNEETNEETNEESLIEKKDKKIGGITIKEVNKTSSILVHCRLDADKFEEYHYSYHKKKLTIGVNLANLLKALKCMTHFDTMTWFIDDEDLAKLNIVLQSQERKEKKLFRLNLMDLDDEKYEVDPVKFPYSAHFPSQDFHKYCKDMSSAGIEKMEIKCTDNTVFFSGKGNIGIADFQVGESIGGLQIEVNTEENEIVQGLFELKYLNVFTKCTGLCNIVTLFLKNDYPLIVQYSVAALGHIKLVLSPSKSKDGY